ncbi:MAG: hypothetical protein ABSG57_10630 [Candidatus Bathyarchaeia archaeon]
MTKKEGDYPCDAVMVTDEAESCSTVLVKFSDVSVKASQRFVMEGIIETHI